MDLEILKIAKRNREDFEREALIPLEDIDCPEQLERVNLMLKKYGVVFITDAINAQQVKEIHDNLVNTTNACVGTNYPSMQSNSIHDLACKLTAVGKATGIIADKKSGMLNVFPFRKDETPTINLQNSQEPVDLNPWYSQINLDLLERHPKLAALLGCLGIDNSGLCTRKLSEDSAKIATLKNPPTPAHVDIYSRRHERIQACLHVSSSYKELGYLPTTTEIRQYLKPHLDNQTSGFRPIPEAVALPQFWVAPRARTLALWSSGVIHGEQNFGLNLEKNPCAVRLYLGTHSTDLALSDLAKLSVAAHRNLTISRFHKLNPITPAQLNKMSTGSTGQFTKCSRTAIERQQLVELARATESWEEEWKTLSSTRKQLAGFTQPLSELPSEFSRLLRSDQQRVWNEQASVNRKTIQKDNYQPQEIGIADLSAALLTHQRRLNFDLSTRWQ